MGKFAHPAQGPARSGLQARHGRTAERDHRGDHARSGTGRGNVGGADQGRPLRQPRPPARNPGRHFPAALQLFAPAKQATVKISTLIYSI